MREKEDIHDRLAMAKENRRSMERTRQAHMALPTAAAAAATAAAAGLQGRTHGVVLPAFLLVSCHHL